MNKGLTELKREAEQQGWRVEITGGGHYKWYPPDPAQGFVVSSTTPTNSNLRNHIALLKRRGFEPTSERRVKSKEECPVATTIKKAEVSHPRSATINEELLSIAAEALSTRDAPIVLPNMVTAKQVSQWIFDHLQSYVPDINKALLDSIVPIMDRQDATIALLSQSVLALEQMVNEVADQFKQNRDLYAKDIPRLRQDVADVKASVAAVKSITLADVEGVLREYVKQQRAAMAAEWKASDDATESTVADLISQLRDEMIEKINVAQDKVVEAANPLEALRKRMAK